MAKRQGLLDETDFSIIKTVRLPKRVVNFIEKIAMEENKKFNTIIAEELERYVYFTHRVRKFSKGNEVLMSDRFFELVLDCLTDNTELIKEKAFKAGKEWGKEYLLLWSKEINTNKYSKYKELKYFIAFLDLVSKYSNLFRLDIIENIDSINIIIYHNYNSKYSLLLMYYYMGFLENITDIKKKNLSMEPKDKSLIISYTFL